jgi:hypothetical protein
MPNVRVFADLYMRDVAGMVLVAPDERDVETTHQLDEIWRGIDERNLGQLTFCRDAIAAGKKFPLTPPPDHPGWTCLDYSFRGVPDPRFSPELGEGVSQDPPPVAGFTALAVIIPAYHIPPTSKLPAAERTKFNETSRIFEAKLLDLSSNSKKILADTGAFVQFEKPDIVIDAIRDVYDQTRWRLSTNARIGRMRPVETRSQRRPMI